ncbi:sulfite exporter TauE/SafE family protein [Pandoraea sp.]|uniref:sulfite exporter TauE/SafE family protein n=1 Tax=Pandoraea sp. TaxID=1883445 RepID=UPI00122B90A2|nr:sulfite exporter TauE/SafE family protein [Pandoraea sp.]MDE2287773.1 sulfite exporter TauE/SafE family protein [Burkholderiales bacterium]TAL54233.1 MAG: sulfite exporter TauE/SafE family protein [Pandoraea sp.]TAM15876.1 MAG: sulfite exporter TauE/SafE family protein [Pandoraea sp.]
MSLPFFAFMSLIVAVAALVQGTVGVGFALIVAPVVGLLEPQLLPVTLLILMLPLNFYVCWREHPQLDKGGATWITAGRSVGALGGLWIIARMSQHDLNLLIGVSTILAVLATLYVPSFTPGRKSFVTAGLITGVTETATGIGGPALALVFQHHRAPILRSTIALCFALGELISLALLLAAGHVTLTLALQAAALIPAVFVGATVSRLVHHRLDDRLMRSCVLGFALISGVLILIQTLFSGSM